MNYFTNEGIYGALNFIHFDDPSYRPEILIQLEHNDKILKSTVWGQTCDGQDKLFDDFEMKILRTGDYLIWFNIGAYSTECASYFNGFPIPKRFYTFGTNQCRKDAIFNRFWVDLEIHRSISESLYVGSDSFGD